MAKDFKDFMDQYNQDGSAHEMVYAAREIAGIDENDLFPAKMEGYFLAMSLLIAKDMLGEYHKWINS